MKAVVSCLILSLVAIANAAKQVVTVAPNGAIMYSPSSVIAAVGDTIEFQFASNNHSVAQAAFSSPCQPLSGGIWSGFVLTTGSQSAAATSPGYAGYKRQNSMPTFTITVNDTNPAFFYCAQISHCQLGMVFALNPNASQTLDAFHSAASHATTTVPSEAPQGGILSSSGSTSTPSSGSSASSSPKSSGSSIAINFGTLLGAFWACAFFLR